MTSDCDPITTTPTAPEWGSSSSSVEMTPTWGNVREQNEQSSNTEEADFWSNRVRVSERIKRNESIERGGSPPPKLKEENLFSEGDSRPRKKRPVYMSKEETDNWGWGNEDADNKEETLSDMVEGMNERSFDVEKKRKRFKNKVKWDGRGIKESNDEDSDSDESSKDVGWDSRSNEDKEPSLIVDDESGQSEDGDLTSSEEDEGSPSAIPHSPARGDCIMSTSEALRRLTNDAIMDDGESEWLIVESFEGQIFPG